MINATHAPLLFIKHLLEGFGLGIISSNVPPEQELYRDWYRQLVSETRFLPDPLGSCLLEIRFVSLVSQSFVDSVSASFALPEEVVDTVIALLFELRLWVTWPVDHSLGGEEAVFSVSVGVEFVSLASSVDQCALRDSARPVYWWFPMVDDAPHAHF